MPWTKSQLNASQAWNSACWYSRTVFDYDSKTKRLDEIDAAMAEAGFWDKQEAAQQSVMERKSLLSILEPLNETIGSLDDLQAMLEMASEDASFAAEVPGESDRMEKLIEGLELKALLGGTHDGCDAILSITPGTVAPTPTTGLRCSCACTPHGPRKTSSKSNW